MAKSKSSKRRIQIDEFLPAYLSAADKGQSLEEFAASLGVKPASVAGRIVSLRKRLGTKADAIPDLRKEGNPRVLIDQKVEAILAGRESRPAPKPTPSVDSREEEDAHDPLADLLG